jgi:hypothetical protein
MGRTCVLPFSYSVGDDEASTSGSVFEETGFVGGVECDHEGVV